MNAAKNEELIRSAISCANVNALRVALYQLTEDPELERVTIMKSPVRGGALLDYVLLAEDEAMVKSKAEKYLLDFIPYIEKDVKIQPSKPPPSAEECERLITMFHGGEKISPAMVKLGIEELAFEPNGRYVNWNHKPDAKILEDYHVIIIGAGLCGIVAAISLDRLGIPYTIIDREKGAGGTWAVNTYPDVRVDTLGYGFKYKFESDHCWKDIFPRGGEIRDYLVNVANRFGVSQKIVFEREVVAATWNETSQTWGVTTKLPDGSEEPFTRRANAIISAVGLFSTPELPKIPGLTEYKGHAWHTTSWNHQVDWRGKDIAVIGNGSSGAQLIPILSKESTRLSVYQRTPQWMAPSDSYRSPVPDPVKWLLKTLPYYENWNCYSGFLRACQLQDVQINDRQWRAKGGLVNPRNDQLRKSLTEYIHKSVNFNPQLASQLIPSYAPLVRRLVMDSGYYEALTRPNTELITSGIERITLDGIRTRDGKERSHDIIVLACGFQPTHFLHPVKYTGRNGVTLDKTWGKDGARSYVGMLIPGYPNLFTMYGPNHQPRGGPSILSWAEIWARFAAEKIVWMIESNVKSMTVKQSTFDAYNQRLDEATKELLWEMEGSSYFLNEHGRQAVNAPWTVEEQFRLLVDPINTDDFELIT